MKWLDRMEAMLGKASGMTEPKILKFKDPNKKPQLCDWVSFPWGDKEAVKALSQSEYGMEYIGELIYLSNRLSKVNKMSEMPGKTRLPGRISHPERFWAEKPVPEKDWKSGKIGLRLMFSESPRTNIVIANKSDRTIRIGSRREVHLGSVEASYNLSQRYLATEELAHHHLAQTVYHYACNKPVEYQDIQHCWSTDLKLFDHGRDVTLAQKELSACNLGDGKIGIPNLATPREVRRDDTKFRTQVWSRYEGVARWEAVATEENSSGGSYEHDLQGVTDKTPVFKDDSPEALFEIRPAEFNEGDHAAMIMATPTFVLCGMKNPNDSGKITPSYQLSHTAAQWAEGKEQPDEDNFFAVRNKKNYIKNWSDGLPSGKDGAMPMSFGISGGIKSIHGKTKKCPVFNGMTGLELFGEKVVLIGAGIKKDARWTSGLLLKEDEVELCKSSQNKEEESLISMKSELLELRNKVASLESMIRMDKDGISCSVFSGAGGPTKIDIDKDAVGIYVKGRLIGRFTEEGFKTIEVKENKFQGKTWFG